MITCINVTDKNKTILREQILMVLKPAWLSSGYTADGAHTVCSRSRAGDDDDDDDGISGKMTNAFKFNTFKDSDER